MTIRFNICQLVAQQAAESKAWMYLQPIFDSPDIMKQLPTEGPQSKYDAKTSCNDWSLHVTRVTGCHWHASVEVCRSRSAVVFQVRNFAWLTASGARHCVVQYLGISRASHMSISQYQYMSIHGMFWRWNTLDMFR